ncbi:sensor histidine kinase [Marinimicrococcus flavescens]|uniref:histidine kinase n=1 Tax=Marinimicrococcus flavescens TaxID=3031815 RepID=A0AAP3UYZ3_9PROT|nr:HWE histidine kinase domain-containing protein [Marinimicrococcus flavescens]
MSRQPATIAQQPMLPDVEAGRLDAVRRYDILDTPPDGAFDRITRIAARLFGVPIAIVSIVDHDRIWFKSHHGLDVRQIDRAPGLCASAILGTDPWIVENAAADARTLANPLVAGGFGLRFYAGVPLHTHDGHNLGTLCVIDRQPRPVSEDEIATLADLAAVVMDELELRLSARDAIAQKNVEIEERRRIQEQQLVLMSELGHRVKNTLATVQAIAGQTARSSASMDEFIEKFDGRLLSLARAHGLLSSGGWDGGELEEVALLSLRPLRNEAGDNVEVAGPVVRLQPRAALALNLTLHELATNAAKYGALSSRSGRVALDWSIEQQAKGAVVVLRWLERGGPQVAPQPSRRGFGSMVLNYSIRRELEGSARTHYHREGLEVVIEFPVEGNVAPD